MTNKITLLIEISLELNAFKFNAAEPFLWASGYHMPLYNDNRRLLESPTARKIIVEAFSEQIETVDILPQIIVGTATSGIPHATSLADHLKLPLAYVRSSAKGHGTQSQIEGANIPGQRAVVIEDLLSTGSSCLKVVKVLRDANIEVDTALAIFSYGFKSCDEAFKATNCSYSTLFAFPDLLSVAQALNKINKETAESLTSWYEDPYSWGEKNGFPRVEK